MKTIFNTILFVLIFTTVSLNAQNQNYTSNNFIIEKVAITHHSDLGVTVWEIKVKGKAGETKPIAVGQLDGAPVLGYVFPTNLKPTDVGFNQTEGIVALAVTSHPDFDDTPLWDENTDKIYNNDGVIWHPHWVILVEDKRVKGGLAVKQFKKEDTSVILPPTNPGMPMYMDSPGYPVLTKNETIKIIIPDYRINHKTDFNFDGVSAYMKVNTSIEDLPMLGVYDVFSVASGDLSLPYKIKKQ